LTMTIGMGEITKENWKEFAIRLQIYERLFGSFLMDKDGNSVMTPELVFKHIGLRTNVFPKETKAKWLSRVWKNYERDFDNVLKDVEKLTENDAVMLSKK